MRVLYKLKKIINVITVFILFIVCTNFSSASEDWVSDLRYKEYLIEADKGSAAAMYELGVMTERGRGTEKNVAEAIIWYNKAIKNNNASAYVRLGKLYLEGVSVEKNYDLAFQYLQSGIKSKSSGAHYYIAVMYENGYGTTKNLSIAKTNYDKAAKWGHYGAKEKSNKLAAVLKKRKSKQAKVKNDQIELAQYEEPVKVAALHKNQTKIDTRKEIKKSKSKNRFVTIKDIKKSLLAGMWFNGDSPLGFLPSPRTYCISKNKVGLRCVSKEILRNTGREKVYYLIESKISNIDNYGDFTIIYKNKVTKVDVYNKLDESGETYRTRIKVGPQKKSHVLRCNVAGNTVNCNKNNMQNYVFFNLSTKQKKANRRFITAYE